MDPSDVSEAAKSAAGSAASGIGGELVKIGKAALGQVIGKSPFSGTSSDQPQPTSSDISEMKKKDDEQSDAEHKQVVAKINAIYAEYAQKRKREEEDKKQREEVAEKEEKRLEEIQTQEQRQNPNAAIAKTRTEIGRNFGAE